MSVIYQVPGYGHDILMMPDEYLETFILVYAACR